MASTTSFSETTMPMRKPHLSDVPGGVLAPSRHARCNPMQTELLPNRERPPTGQHRVQCMARRSRRARPPRAHVSVHEMFGGLQCSAMRTDELLAGLCAATSGDTLEGGPLGDETPESPLETERLFDDELGQVVRKVPSRRHGGSLKALPLRRCRDPGAQPSVVDLVERYLHTRVILARASASSGH